MLGAVTSIWIFSAALTLPALLVGALVVVVRVQRYLIARKPLHTFVFTSAAIACSALGVHGVSAATRVRSWLTAAGSLPHEPAAGMLIAAGGVAAAVVVYFLVQAVLVGVARGLITGRWSLPDLLGDRRTNTFILTTLCLAVCAAVLEATLLPPLLVVMVPIAVRCTRVEQQARQDQADKEQLRVDALHDPKTGLLNDRGFSPAAAVQLYGDQLVGRGSALLFVDVDVFKRWNTRLGHIGGDQVLHALARVLRSCVREADLTCRWGGEEFVVLLTGTEAAEAVQIADRIRLSFATMTLTITKPAGGHQIGRDGEGCTLSIGVALSPPHGTDLEDIANPAMKQAKSNGRNQVVLAPGASTPAVSPIG